MLRKLSAELAHGGARTPGRGRRVRSAMSCALAGLSLFACAETLPEPEIVVLVTLDALRADHLGVYGYPRAASPFVDWLGRAGVVVERAYAASATTSPSHASLFTGLHVHQHGVRSNHRRMNAAHTTLATFMEESGYTPAAFVSIATHFVESGLNQGFRVFDRPRPLDGRLVRRGRQTVDAALRWLDARPAPERIFLWVHLWDLHTPYRAPAFASTAEESTAHARFLREQHGTDMSIFAGDDANLLALIDLYDGGLLAADAALSRLYEGIRERRSDAEMLWVVTSDHGEGLGNHGWLLHGKYLYDEQLEVPLIFHWSSGALAGTRVDAVVTHVDVLPTLLDLVGASGLLAEVPLEGRSIATLLRGGEDPDPRLAFSERRSYATRNDRASAADLPPPKAPSPFSVTALLDAARRAQFESGERVALQDGRYKLIHHSELGNELYDLRSDPHETENLIGSGTAAEARLREALRERLARVGTRAGAGAPISWEERDALRELGYLE